MTFSAACGYKKNIKGELEPVTNASRRRTRLGAILVYLTMHLVFSVRLIINLGTWDNSKTGKCYEGHFISGNHANNDSVIDKVYVLLTALALSVSLLAMIIYLIIMDVEERQGIIKPRLVATYRGTKIKVITLMGFVSSFTLFPLHLYMTIALRFTNQALSTGSNENQWSFGQSLSVIMLLVTCRECICAWSGRYHLVIQDNRQICGDPTDITGRLLLMEKEEG